MMTDYAPQKRSRSSTQKRLIGHGRHGARKVIDPWLSKQRGFCACQSTIGPARRKCSTQPVNQIYVRAGRQLAPISQATARCDQWSVKGLAVIADPAVVAQLVFRGLPELSFTSGACQKQLIQHPGFAVAVGHANQENRRPYSARQSGGFRIQIAHGQVAICDNLRLITRGRVHGCADAQYAFS